MTEELITLETAKLAKEKGYNWQQSGCYVHPPKYVLSPLGHVQNHNRFDGDSCFSAPSQALLQKWLREVHSVEINIIRLKNSYMFFIFKNYKDPISKKGFKNYEEVLEEALKYGLKLIK